MKKKLLFIMILFFAAITSVMAQRVVSGRVTSEQDGDPVPGANIVLKGTSTGTTTDFDGNYRLSIPEAGGVLAFSSIGFVTREVEVGAQSVIDVSLESDIQQLNEVVVTGYTSQSREKLAGSIGTVTAKSMDQVPMPSFDQILQGRTPGLYVTSGSGQPGAGATVRIRGSGSINASNTPLYVMDGIPINASEFATLNPNDFESVNVLKDASATALYGSRGANGVIVIQTKRGRSGKAKINYRFQTGWSQQARERFEMMNSEEKIAFEYLVGSGPTDSLSRDPEDSLDVNILDSLKNINTDWKDVFTRTGRITSHELNVSGGSESTNYYVSFNYLNQEGQALRSDLERYIIRFNLTSNLSNKLIVGMNSTVGFSKSGLIESENAIALANPFAAVYLANPYDAISFDSLTRKVLTGTDRTGANAYDRILNSTNNRNELKGVFGAYVEYNFIEGLTAKAQVGVDYRQRDFERWIDPASYAGGSVTPGNAGLLNNAFNRRLQWINTNTLAYTKTFSEVHDFSMILGVEALKRTFNSFTSTGYGLNEKLPLSNAAITTGPDLVPSLGGSWSENTLLSLFSILDYTYNSKYNFRGTLRRDGSSRFGEENQYAVLWSVAGSWNLHRESFMRGSFANELRLRISYGRSGNQDFEPENSGDFRSLTTYVATSYGGEGGLAPRSVGDPAYKWEISNQLNIGVDFGLFSNRISGSAEVYNNITSDLFITQQLSRTSGFSSRQVNAGKMRNRGIETKINFDIVRTGGLLVSVGGNFTYNQNEITDLGQVDEFEQGTSIIRVGLPLGSHYVVEWAGVSPANGQPLYKDADGNVTAIYSADNSVAKFGTSEPPVWGGFNAEIDYKGLNFGIFWTYNHGYTIFNNQRFFQENPDFANYNLSSVMNDMWKQPGDITGIQSYKYGRKSSSKDLEDASFLRLRNVILSYTIPQKLMSQVSFISNVRLYVQGQNLLTFTKFTGFDPENFNNIAQYEYPASRIYTLGIDVTF